jgi:hypothetical protein
MLVACLIVVQHSWDKGNKAIVVVIIVMGTYHMITIDKVQCNVISAF